jgi:hypothetical protein
MSNRAAVPDFRAYEDGKHRRYELLFAVNGGAFAIAKLPLCSPRRPKEICSSLEI